MKAGYCTAVLLLWSIAFEVPAQAAPFRIFRASTPAVARVEETSSASAKSGSLFHKARAMTIGMVKDGPLHTLHAIRAKPKTFAAMLLGLGVVGGISRALNIDPAPIMLGASGVAFAFQLKQNFHQIRNNVGLARWQKVGSEVLWPSFLVGATAAGGAIVGHGGADLGSHAAKLKLAPEITRAFAQSVIIGGDAPTVFMTGLGSPSH